MVLAVLQNAGFHHPNNHFENIYFLFIFPSLTQQPKQKLPCGIRNNGGAFLSPCTSQVTPMVSGFGGLGVSVLASGTQVRGFKPGRSRRIFKGEKILRKRSKAVGPMSQICGM
jgi:hypothetical protein